MRVAARWTPYLITALMLAAALASMVIWTRNIGIQEDWRMVDAWLGREPDLLAWLWSQNNDHRLPVGRAIYLVLLRATDDFRSGMVASQLLLAALSLLFVSLAVHLRGDKPRIADALFPLALLHLGHWENLLWGWQIQFVSSVYLCGLLLWAVTHSARPGRGEAGVAVVAMTLLPVSGANGIALFAAFVLRREDRLSAALLAAAALLAVGITGFYFTDYDQPNWRPYAEDLGQFLTAIAAYFSMAMGPWAAPGEFTPGQWTSPRDQVPALIVLAVLTLGALGACAVFVLRGRFSDPRSLGLAAFIGCNILLGFIIAYTRGAWPTYMPSRYALFAVMPLIATVFVVQLYAPPKLAWYFPALLAGLLLMLLPLNLRVGFEWRDWYLQGTSSFEADAARSLPLEAIAERNTGNLLHSCDGCLIRHLIHLRAAGIKPFASLPPPSSSDGQEDPARVR
jgi:hypothetical protein